MGDVSELVSNGCVFVKHLQDILDPEMSALNWMMKSFPDVKEIEEMRRMIGRFGLTGQQQVGLVHASFKTFICQQVFISVLS